MHIEDIKSNPIWSQAMSPASEVKDQKLLEAIKQHGVLSKIAVRQVFDHESGTLVYEYVDGERVHAAMKALGIEPKSDDFVEVDFESDAHYLYWKLSQMNDDVRRTPDKLEKYDLAFILDEKIAERGVVQFKKDINYVPGKSKKFDRVEFVSKTAGVSNSRYKMFRRMQRNNERELLMQVRNGDLSINKAITQYQAQTQKQSDVSVPGPTDCPGLTVLEGDERYNMRLVVDGRTYEYRLLQSNTEMMVFVRDDVDAQLMAAQLTDDQNAQYYLAFPRKYRFLKEAIRCKASDIHNTLRKLILAQRREVNKFVKENGVEIVQNHALVRIGHNDPHRITINPRRNYPQEFIDGVCDVEVVDSIIIPNPEFNSLSRITQIMSKNSRDVIIDNGLISQYSDEMHDYITADVSSLVHTDRRYVFPKVSSLNSKLKCMRDFKDDVKLTFAVQDDREVLVVKNVADQCVITTALKAPNPVKMRNEYVPWSQISRSTGLTGNVISSYAMTKKDKRKYKLFNLKKYFPGLLWQFYEGIGVLRMITKDNIASAVFGPTPYPEQYHEMLEGKTVAWGINGLLGYPVPDMLLMHECESSEKAALQAVIQVNDIPLNVWGRSRLVEMSDDVKYLHEVLRQS